MTPRIAYFSMEIALEPAVPTYSGGLGVLAGDVIRAAADLALPMAGVTLVYRQGYFRQRLDGDGRQHETPDVWVPERAATRLPQTAVVTIEQRRVEIAIWRYVVHGAGGAEVPVYLLDTDVEGNAPEDRALTDVLYGGDARYRLAQEAVLGIGGVAALRAVHGAAIDVFHMNEGHSALLSAALVREALEQNGGSLDGAIAAARGHAVFTTHTPVPAGHDRFALDLAWSVLGDDVMNIVDRCGGFAHGELNMTELALSMSRYANAVSQRHADVSRLMFPGRAIAGITNGVHAATWVAAPLAAVLDDHVPGWRRNNAILRYATAIPLPVLQAAHQLSKGALVDAVRERTGVELDPHAFTIGFARRAATYKRPGLFFNDLERVRAIARLAGPVQVVFAGKAHPRDEGGKAEIQHVLEAMRALGGDVRATFVPNYDMAFGALITAGVDVWLNNPRPPEEASGTSGMKAALNGVPNLSVRDGWWIEGHIEGVTGWEVRADIDVPDEARAAAASMYDQLERIVPLYYREPLKFAEVMRNAIAINGSYFTTERMVRQYAREAYDAPLATAERVEA